MYFNQDVIKIIKIIKIKKSKNVLWVNKKKENIKNKYKVYMKFNQDVIKNYVNK